LNNYCLTFLSARKVTKPACLTSGRRAGRQGKARPARKTTNLDSLAKTSQVANAKREVF